MKLKLLIHDKKLQHELSIINHEIYIKEFLLKMTLMNK